MMQMVDASDPNAPVRITLHISNAFTIEDLERLRISVYDALADLVVMVNQRNNSGPQALTEEQARVISTVFFKDTVGTALVRVAATRRAVRPSPAATAAAGFLSLRCLRDGLLTRRFPCGL